MKPRIASTARLSFPLASAIAALLAQQAVQAQQYWNTNGTGAVIDTANWGTSLAGPFTNAFTDNGDIVFGASSAITGATVNVGNITVNNASTVTFTAGGTLGTGGTVRTLDIGAGSTLNLAGQALSTAAGTGFIKNGDGILISSNANTYAGGFTLNAGTVAVGGVNAMGGGTGNTLTINGGTIRSNSTAARDLSGKFTGGITVGGNFTLGDATNNGTLTFNNNTALGASNRTITADSSAVLGGVVSGSAGVGLTKEGNGNLTLSGANTFTGAINLNAGTLTIGGSAYGALGGITPGTNGPSSISVASGATLSFQQAGTGATTANYYQPLTINGGRVITAGGSTGNTLALNLRGAVDLGGDTSVIINGNSTLIIPSTTTVNIGSNVLTIQTDGSLIGNNIGAPISGVGGSFVKNGGNALTLAGNNTFTGATTVNAGALILDYATQNNSKLSDNAALTLAGSTITLGGASGNHTEVVASTTLADGSASSVTRSGANTAVLQLGTITNNAGSINFGAAGLATTNNTNNSSGILGFWATITGDGWAVNSTNGSNGLITGATYTDVTRLDSGTKTITSGAGHTRIIEGTGLVGDVTMAAPGTTSINTLVNSASTAGTVNVGTGNTLATTAILQGTGAGALTVGLTATPGTLTALTAGGDLLVVANAAITINSAISDNTSASSLTKYGTNTLTLSGDNTYTGATTVNFGTLAITHNNALGTTAGSTTINGGNGTGGITLSLSSATSDLTISENLNFNGNAGGRANLTNSSAQNHTLTGAIDVSSATNLTQFTSTGTGSITISGDITGTMSGGAMLFLRGDSASATNRVIGSLNLSGGDLGKTDAGTWLVGASGETYSWANTIVANGTLKMGLANTLPSSGGLTMGDPTGARSPILDLNGFNQTVAGITYNGGTASTGTRTITNTDAGNAAVLTVNNATDYSPTGSSATNSVILAGNLGLIKQGAGTLRFSGANTHTGNTTVNGGILSLNNNLALQNSALITTGAGFLNLETGITAPIIGGLSGATGDLATIISAGYGNVTALTLRPGTGSTVTYGGQIADGAANMTLTKGGVGTQILTGANTFTGNVTITGTASGNTLRIEHNEALGPVATVKNIVPTGSNRQVSILELANGITVDANKTITTAGKSFMAAGEATFGSPVFLRNGSGNNAWLGNILITSGGGAYSIESAAGTLTLGDTGTASVLRNDVVTSTRTFDFRGAGDVLVNSQVVTNGTSLSGINKYGTGTLTLPRTDNTATAGNTFAVGTTVVQNMAASGSPSSIGSGTTFNFGGTFRHVGAANSTSNRAFGLVGASPTLESSGAGSLALTSTTAVNLIDGANTTVAAFASGDNVLTGVDVHTLIPGMTIAGSNIAVGTKIAAINYDTRQITLDTPTTGAQTTHLAVTVTGSGDINRTFTLGGTNTGANLVASPLGNPAGTGSLALVKEGVGSWNLSGLNTYSGATTVSAGTLFVTGSLSNSAVTVQANGTLGGSGGLGKGLTIETGGNLDLTGATLGVDSTGILSLAGGSLTLGNLSFTDLVGWDWFNADNGTYELISGGFTVDFGSTTFLDANSAYDFGNGKSGYFTSGSLNAVIIPEPSAALLGGLGLLALLRRRR